MIKNSKFNSVILSLFVIIGLYMETTNAFTAGFYVGAGAGVSRLDTKESSLFDNKSWGSIESSVKQGGLSWKGFTGFNFNENLGVELGYTKYAISKSSGMVRRPGTSLFVSNENSLNAISIVGKAGIPLGETGISLYALGGGAQVNSHLENRVYLGNVYINANSISESKFRPIYGAGISFAMTENWTVNLELSRIQGEEDNVKKINIFPNADALILNLAYQF